MRLAYLLPDPGIPVGGTKGASVHVGSLSEALVAQGAEVTLFAPTLLEQSPRGVRTVHIDMGRVRSGPQGESDRVAAMQSFYDQVRAHLEIDRPDIIHERLSLFAGGGTQLSQDLQVPRQVEVNAPVAFERWTHFGLTESSAAHQAERSALQGAKVLAVSTPLARWAERMGATSASIVHNGANTDALNPQKLKTERHRIREELDLGERPTIGFVGSLKPWHGLQVLLQAVALMGLECDVALVVVGDGPGRAALLDQARGLNARVKFISTGAVRQDLVAPYLAAMDISVAPYTPLEPFYFSPLKIAEAMAAGLAVVASDFESVRDLLADTGRLVAPGDATALSEALKSLIEDVPARQGLANAARQRAVSLLDWRGVASRTLEHARTCIESFGSPCQPAATASDAHESNEPWRVPMAKNAT